MPDFGELIQWVVAAYAAIYAMHGVSWVGRKLREARQRLEEWKRGRALGAQGRRAA